MTTSIVLLGTGNPNPDPDRSGPSVAVIVNDNTYIFDAGPGIVRRAQEACSRGIDQLHSRRLNRLFLTHLHSDHTIGIPDILLTPWVMERKEPLKIFGPKGTEDMMKHLTYAYEKDIDARRRGLEKANDIGWRSEVTEISEGEVYQDEGVLIMAFRVKHSNWDEAYGYRIVTDEGTIVISGDCSPEPDQAQRYMGADILVHEVYSTNGFRGHSEKWKSYHEGAHTSSTQLAQIATKVRPDRLICYHTLLWGATEKELLDEISSEYNGKVIIGKDLDTFTLSRKDH